jgi:hypothetical protein
MRMSTVDLDRRFLEWKEGDNADAGVWARYRLADGTLGWSDLLKRRRVVVLAEGGSGKSTEFIRQAGLQAQAGSDAWYLTVQDVAQNGIENSLPQTDRNRYRDWLASDRPAWFFVDSVDEARLNHVRFEQCLRQLGHGIAGAEGRAHVIISSRHSDWEPQRDAKRLNKELPLPNERASPPPPTPDEHLVSILHHEKNETSDKPAESLLVVVMVGLDADRVRRFAEGQGLTDSEPLLARLEQADLWDFVCRPRDLGWLLDFWRREGRLGTLAETLQASLTERLKEPDPERARLGILDSARAMKALERLGAAMVFSRVQTIAIPDHEVQLAPSERALKIDDVLADHSGVERTELLSRPVFDPGTFARTRFHNDNLGVVRSYLAARWLSRLRSANLGVRDMFALLFGDCYGVELIRPSVRETAAWLALWDRDVAREVARREPWILLTGGDPGSLSAETRRNVLTELAQRMTSSGFVLPQLDNDSLRRFSKPDLSATVRALWVAHPQHAELRWLLLRIISLGEIAECVDLAADVALSPQSDRRYRILAAKAIGSSGGQPDKRRYVEFVLSNLATLPNRVIWDAIDQFFPVYITVTDLLETTQRIDVTDDDGGLGFEWQGPDLVQRLDAQADIEKLLRGLLDQLGGRAGSLRHRPDKPEDSYVPAIAAAAYRLLERSSEEQVPQLVIEAALRLGQDHQRTSMRSWRGVKDLPDLLLRSSNRRRVVFWEAAARFADHAALGGRPLEDPYQMRLLGWPPRLTPADLGWLLADGPIRQEPSQRRLAVNAALDVYRAAGEPVEMLERIRTVAMAEPAMREAFEAWATPRDRTPAEKAQESELKELMSRNAAERAAHDQGWIDFVRGLREDPEQMRQLRPVSDKGVDSRLFSLWQLLSASDHGKNRYAIDSVASVEPILGARLAEELRLALIKFWRTWQPRLTSTRGPTERNQIQTIDCMGITGVTLEAHSDPAWATRLNTAEAERAAAYATLELNGFPRWLTQLGADQPTTVVRVLHHEIKAELDGASGETQHKMLQSLSYADDAVKTLMAPKLLQELTERAAVPTGALEYMLEVTADHVIGSERAELLRVCLERFRSTESSTEAALYIGAAFLLDSDVAADALTVRLDELSEGAQTAVVEQLLPLLFGDRFLRSASGAKKLTFSCLARFVRTAYATVRVGEDISHADGMAYSPGPRDHAEWARNAAFKTLVETPGRATFEMLLRFRDEPEFPIPRDHLTSLAMDRAGADSEHAAWHPADAREFEETNEAPPRTPLDLQRLALTRFADIQDDLLTSDFAQGRTLKQQPNETAVQGWVADRLDLTKRLSYSVERESRVVEEKEPDIRLRAKQSQATLPIEVKVAESWTLEGLEDALVTQLCGKYLKAKDAHHGVLLIVHQHARQRGWLQQNSGIYLSFPQLIEHLKTVAGRIAAEHPQGLQPEIAVLDVSSVRLERSAGSGQDD